MPEAGYAPRVYSRAAALSDALHRPVPGAGVHAAYAARVLSPP